MSYGGPFIRELTLENFLSYGTATTIPLGGLNVLIGPNGSGKSNLIEAISILRAASGDLHAEVRRGGGIGEWIWKGSPGATARVEAVSANRGNPRSQPLRHTLAFRQENQTFRIADESVENQHPQPGHSDVFFYYRYQNGRPALNVTGETTRYLQNHTVDNHASILSQVRDPERYPEVSFLASTYSKIRIYREWSFGRNTVFREPQKADMRNDRLEDDFSNLGLVLNRLRRSQAVRQAILSNLGELYEGISDVDVIVEGGTVQVFFMEGSFTIPATRLSDGTLRYLCLLAILLDPDPPPLICIEEPELGLHPDILTTVAELLIAASERTQLVVTTHSDILVSALSDQPESVLVCDKHDGSTQVTRLESDDLEEWLGRYRLGQLWLKGHFGGTRW